MRLILTLLAFVCIFSNLDAQRTYSVGDVSEFILNHGDQQLESSDLTDLRIDRQYTDDKTGVTYIYATQTLNGIPIFNAVASIAISNRNDMTVVNSKFIPDAISHVNSSQFLVSGEAALRKALTYGGHSEMMELSKDAVRSTGEVQFFHSEQMTQHGSKVRPVYFNDNGDLRLAWNISYFVKSDTDYRSIRVDAGSGALLDKTSFTVHCKFDGISHQHNHIMCEPRMQVKHQAVASGAGDGATYNVYPLPIESPLHGVRSMVVEPADSVASPFGWHDLNGVEGADTVVTEGNNTKAWLDRDGNYFKDRDVTGGNELVFDFEQDNLTEPVDYEDAATTNLFYMVNMMHDFSYAYGFTEAAGNFQLSNGDKGGQENDEVIALSQFNANTGGNLNNATFSTPEDGGSGTMRMFLWTTRNDISVFSVTSPAAVDGLYPSRTANFGALIDSIPLEGEVVLVDDGIGITTDACEEIENDSEVAGKIAMIDRGDCEFGFKILNAERDGAIGAIICNNVDGLLSGQMGAGAVGGQVTIPSVFISKADCEKIRVYAGNGLEVKFQVPPDNGQPDRVDGSLDNGIIAHEFGHGISTRFTGGPDNSDCLRTFNLGGRQDGEQMGEGWSDFFSLVLTVQPGDDAGKPRGIGNYALRNPVDGNGIRDYPYSRDMSVNPVTYYNAYEASIPHGVGHVWCSMLWDMYWNFVDRYGWSPDFIHGELGNNKAIQLVMEGMKIQPCNPGFVDGRDAILQADMLLCDGENQDIIWEAFARRGLGQYASQGESSAVADGKEDYTIPAQYIPSVKISKMMSPVILKGENIEVNLEIRNDLDEDVTNVLVQDAIPDGTTVDLSQLPASATVNGDFIEITLATLAAGEQQTISYQLETPAVPSKLLLFDDMEASDTDGGRWITYGIAGNSIFSWADDDAVSGSHSWKISDIGGEEEQAVFSFFEATPSGSKPVLRFTHKYDTDSGNDGGVVELSTDQFTTTEDLGEYMFREGYPNNIRQSTFPDRRSAAFSGLSGNGSVDAEWVDTYIDLSEYIGAEPFFQFRFASDNALSSNFWVFDDFTLFDAVTYNSEACLTYDGSTDMTCALAPEWGTIVEPEEFSSTSEKENISEKVAIYPNPGIDEVTIRMTDMKGEAQISVRDMSGRLVHNQSIERIQDSFGVRLNISNWAAGIYTVEINSGEGIHTRKFVKK